MGLDSVNPEGAERVKTVSCIVRGLSKGFLLYFFVVILSRGLESFLHVNWKTGVHSF